MSPSPLPAAAPIATPAPPPISPAPAPTAAPPTRPSAPPDAIFPVRLGVSGLSPAASAFCRHAATSNAAASRPFNWSFAFDRSIGSGPAQATRLSTIPIVINRHQSLKLISPLLPSGHLIPLLLETPVHKIRVRLARMGCSRRKVACEQAPDRSARRADHRTLTGRARNRTADGAACCPDSRSHSGVSRHTPSLPRILFRAGRFGHLPALLDVLLRNLFADRLKIRI